MSSSHELLTLTASGECELPNSSTSYGSDQINRLDIVKDGDRTLADYDYHGVGNLIQTKLVNSSVESRQYDTY
ncbi:MAG: hypothetical protein V7L14_25315 [Nostoc sp.]|uniref:hypothetical protein n=1 Tax=Nostoc sp. TaxID=1180 RepID=UPI002FFA69FC